MIRANIVEMLKPSGTVYLTDNPVDIDYNGNTYQSGVIQDLSNITIGTGAIDGDVEVKINASDQTNIALFSDGEFKGNRILAKQLEFDDSHSVISTSVLFDCIMSHYLISQSQKTRTIKLVCTPIFNLTKKNNALDLSVVFKDYFNDNQTLYWGKKNPPLPSNYGRHKVETQTIVNIGDP